jgi:hypothetical protein
LSKQRVWLLASIGIVLALYVFMADALRVADQGVNVIRNILPVEFNWPLFAIALALMTAPVLRELPVRWARTPNSECGRPGHSNAPLSTAIRDRSQPTTQTAAPGTGALQRRFEETAS